MMNEEIKICVKTNKDLKSLKEHLLGQGFIVLDEYQLIDTYMIEKEMLISLETVEKIFSNYILIRETIGKKNTLILKKKEFNEKGEVIKNSSIKCPIVSCNDAYHLMHALGYKKLLTLNLHNIILSNGINELCIQDVKNLGLYIEMHQKNIKINHNNGNTIEEMINTLSKYDLDIDKSNYLCNKSYEMLKRIIKEEENKEEKE